MESQASEQSNIHAAAAAPLTSAASPASHVPDGYYINKKGKMTKKNRPAKERQEYGLPQVLMSEAELKAVRPGAQLKTFANHPGKARRIRLSLREVNALNTYRGQNGGREVDVGAGNGKLVGAAQRKKASQHYEKTLGDRVAKKRKMMKQKRERKQRQMGKWGLGQPSA
ncbi:uncharacterized protein LY89DRAFT_672292 [Mollisia scopiformis]|uniref:Uncharacterized protein n=1 Tax=Mollisia scopiformis TaxID=149040 RepID=A0A194X1G4_MOLSC|nr:uncharacterized protein LY89DRAFT_672292 [Mollisia scopiformis]KUJ14028.1 hypothetical protein LY89DRAFT_672292 [Mollisia scopiformis]